MAFIDKLSKAFKNTEEVKEDVQSDSLNSPFKQSDFPDILGTKRKILYMLGGAEGIVHLNNVSFLERVTENLFGERVDELNIYFYPLNGADYVFFDNKIRARDYDGVIEECKEKTAKFFEIVQDKLFEEM